MAERSHRYPVNVTWTGNRGSGTSSYRAYGREHEITAGSKPPIPGSSDPAFRGDPGRWNPEEMLVSTLSTCHMLWYLHLAAEAGVVVVGYADAAEGLMAEHPVSGGAFTGVTLRPRVTISAGDPAVAVHLHHEAHAKCFIANSVNFPVGCEAEIIGP